ncbi:topoisomerase [Pseudomonas asuensis]|uniref:Topoisomerase n=1 Tax=Pseudomonas asuensis TaxID=1825787 RepID=A0ABQ2GQP9_9PSED|nr:DUF2726 domain-containing protein [Pseudomonas asuensis]GGM07102.1 topoisomerase [Pseudomonas asuensis]
MIHLLSAHPWLYVGLGVIVFLCVLSMLRPRDTQRAFPYLLNEALFTPAERAFLTVLDEAVGEDYRIFGKVRIADVASVKAIRDQKSWYRAFNKISAKHFDYVLCDKDDLSFVAVIELDDSSHQRPDRQKRDIFVAGVCRAIALPLIQIPVRGAYSIAEVREEIMTALQKSGTAKARRRPVTNRSSRAAVTSETPSPACSKCGSPMVMRKAKQGSNAGTYFWGCSAFPDCRNIMRIEEQA